MGANVSFIIDEEVNSRLEEQLNYGDSKSEFVRKSVKLRLEILELSEDMDLPEDCDNWPEWCAEAIKEKKERDGLPD